MKILLAEADGALAGRLFHLLVKNGYQTTAVKTGQAALDEIGRSYCCGKPPPFATEPRTVSFCPALHLGEEKVICK